MNGEITLKILITADMVPTKTNEEMFASGGADKLLGEELTALFQSADFRMINLEMPLYDGNSPISKAGPCLRADTAAVNLYDALHIDLVTLANNHIMDHGEAGFQSTLQTLQSKSIPYVGVGSTAAEARAPYFVNIDGKRICFYACVEHEFSIVNEAERLVGANPFSSLDCTADVTEARKACDFLIVLYHGGREQYRYPSPELQQNCRALVQAGADLVLCQHSHCIGCMEEYQGKQILYGQGNFVFDEDVDECWDSGLIVEITDGFRIRYLPVERKANTVRLAKGETEQAILDGFKQRSQLITSPEAVRQEYRTLAEKNIDQYLLVMSGVARRFWFRVVNKLSGHRFEKYYLQSKYKKRSLLAMQNMVECEAHRELFLKGLKERIAHRQN